MWQRPTFSLVFLVVATSLAAPARASEMRQPKAAGWPTTDYRSIVRDLDRATGVAVKYLDGSTTLVTDPEWISLLKGMMASVDGVPDKVCLCENYPQVTFLNKDGPLATMEVTHGTKLRFSGAHYSGDYVIDPKIAKLIIELLMTPQAQGFKLHPGPRSGRL